jgi:hypothetical protein
LSPKACSKLFAIKKIDALAKKPNQTKSYASLGFPSILIVKKEGAKR